MNSNNLLIKEKTNADRINLFHKSNRYNTTNSNIRQEKLDNSFKYKYSYYDVLLAFINRRGNDD